MTSLLAEPRGQGLVKEPVFTDGMEQFGLPGRVGLLPLRRPFALPLLQGQLGRGGGLDVADRQPAGHLPPESPRLERLLLRDFPANLFVDGNLGHVHEDLVAAGGVLGHHAAVPLAIDPDDALL